MTVEQVIAVLHQNVNNAKETVRVLCRDFPADLENPHRGSLKNAILSAPEAITEAAKERLALLIGPYV